MEGHKPASEFPGLWFGMGQGLECSLDMFCNAEGNVDAKGVLSPLVESELGSWSEVGFFWSVHWLDGFSCFREHARGCC